MTDNDHSSAARTLSQARNAKMTPEQRSAIAAKASKARWAKAKKADRKKHAEASRSRAKARWQTIDQDMRAAHARMMAEASKKARALKASKI